MLAHLKFDKVFMKYPMLILIPFPLDICALDTAEVKVKTVV